MNRLPPWMKVSLRMDQKFGAVERVLAQRGLHTVCRSARCPNRHACWNEGTATFLTLGERCTRQCRFCAVEKGPLGPPDPKEPEKLADAAGRLNLRHVVITSVTRDDLPDGGARHFASCIQAVRSALPAASIEVLTPDFQGDPSALAVVLDAGPDVFNHNLETVQRLQPDVRPQASYARSLAVLRLAATRKPAVAIKSGLMVGLGETNAEVLAGMGDLLAAGCEILTLGQYLAPSAAHYPVARHVPPAEFDELAAAGESLGFRKVFAGPLVRSSFHAGDIFHGAFRGFPVCTP